MQAMTPTLVEPSMFTFSKFTFLTVAPLRVANKPYVPVKLEIVNPLPSNVPLYVSTYQPYEVVMSFISTSAKSITSLPFSSAA